MNKTVIFENNEKNIKSSIKRDKEKFIRDLLEKTVKEPENIAAVEFCMTGEYESGKS